MNIRRKLRAHTEIHTGPLNDILFILLLFFLIASTLANPNLMKVNNPKGAKDNMKVKQNIIVSVNKDHQYFIGQKPVDFVALDTLLKVQIENARKYIDTPSVVINADSAAVWNEIVHIMSIAKKYNVKVGAHLK